MMKKFFLPILVLAISACSGHKTETTAEATETSTAEVTKDCVTELSDDTVYRPGSAVDMPTILDFNATWCPPCRQFKPVFHETAKDFPNVKFVSVDTDNNPLTAEAFGITAIPTVVFIKTDGSYTTFVGTEDIMPAQKFETLVNSFIQ